MARRDRERLGQVAFADLAMAALGPFAALMIIFLVAAGAAQEKDCKHANAAEEKQLVEDVRVWLDRRAEASDADLEKIRQSLRLGMGRCARQALPEAPSLTVGDVVPEPLTTYCPSVVRRVRAQAGDGERPIDGSTVRDDERAVQVVLEALRSPPPGDGLDHVVDVLRGRPAAIITVQRLVHAALNACLSDPPCEDADADARERLVQALRAWSARRERETSADLALLRQQQCPERVDPTPRGNPQRPHVVPGLLAGYCSATVDAILDDMGDELARVEAERAATRTAVRSCLAQSPEIIKVSSKQLEFLSCKTDFQEREGSGRMPDSAARAFFNDSADDVAAKVAEGRFNRIDIFGHTDQRPVRGQCAGARDNAHLSSLRAHEFRKWLLEAMQRGGDAPADTTALAARLASDEVRVYAIGVGDAQPIVRDATTNAEHAQNRRIELRLVRDRYRGATR